MLIGIINVQWFDNPGAVLLCYAMQYQINVLGFESEVINYTSGGGVGHSNIIKRIYYGCKYRINRQIVNVKKVNGISFGKQLKQRHIKYEKFRQKYLKCSEGFTDPYNECLKGYDCYIVGSDVVWKPEIVNSKDARVYFLDFLDKNVTAKRISFAASVGTNQIRKLEEIKDKYKMYLSKFDNLSMREKESAEYFSNIIQKDIEILLDPVFLLEGEHYSQLINHKTQKKSKYIYFYMLAPNTEMVNFAEKLALHTGYKIIYDIHDADNLYLAAEFRKYGRAAVADGPIEFLKRIRDAEIVITNSFHGTAFSLIFEKSFYTFSCVNAGVDVSLRMENILKRVGLIDRYNPEWGGSLDTVSYEGVRDIIEGERNKAISFLKKSIGGELL